MRIFLTGASGMLAAEVIPELERNGHKALSFDLNAGENVQALDITDKERVGSLIEETKPEYVFHLAAETNVDRCQDEPDHAFQVNTLGTENVALACQKYGVPLLYISTAGVFYGDKETPYTEFDVPNPKNIYGQSKLQGEYAIQNLLSKYFIVRAGWMVGGWEIDKKFVYKIVQQLRDGKTELKAVADKKGTPAFTKYFAKHLLPIINTGRYGIYHLANKGTCSRYDIALKIVEFMDLQSKVSVEAVDSSQFPLPAPRADSEMIQNYKLDLLGLNTMPHWEESLKEYIIQNKDKVACG